MNSKHDESLGSATCFVRVRNCYLQHESTLSSFGHMHAHTHTTPQSYKSVFLLPGPELHILNSYYDVRCRLMMSHSAVVLEQEPRIRNNPKDFINNKNGEMADTRTGERGQRSKMARGG